MLVNGCPILNINIYIPPITVSCALFGRVVWLRCARFNLDGRQTRLQEESRSPKPIYMMVYVLQLSKNEKSVEKADLLNKDVKQGKFLKKLEKIFFG